MEFYQIKPYKYQHTMLKVLEIYKSLSEIADPPFGSDVIDVKYGIHHSDTCDCVNCAVLVTPERYEQLCRKFESFAKFFFRDDFNLYEEFNVVFFNDPDACTDSDTVDIIVLIKHCRYEAQMFDKMKGIFTCNDGTNVNVVSVIAKEDFKKASKGTSHEYIVKDEDEKMCNLARFTKDLCKYYTPNEAIMNNYIVCLNHAMPSYVCYIDAEEKGLLEEIDFKDSIAKACMKAGATPFTKANLGVGKPYLDKERYMKAITKYCEHASLIYDMIVYDEYPMHQDHVIEEDEEFNIEVFKTEFSILREYGYAANFANESLIYLM